jgi:hypothetical protein
MNGGASAGPSVVHGIAATIRHRDIGPAMSAALEGIGLLRARQSLNRTAGKVQP